MSLTSYRAAPPRVTSGLLLQARSSGLLLQVRFSGLAFKFAVCRVFLSWCLEDLAATDFPAP